MLTEENSFKSINKYFFIDLIQIYSFKLLGKQNKSGKQNSA